LRAKVFTERDRRLLEQHEFNTAMAMSQIRIEEGFHLRLLDFS